MPVYRLDIAYDGSGFHGYARQPDTRTVQGELEEALRRALGRREPPATSVAGRTDTGVHASGQVVSVALTEPPDLDRLHRSLNKILAPEILVAAIAEAPADFDARHSARSRSYRYLVENTPWPHPMNRHQMWHVSEPLDVGAMNAGAAHVVGEHDFASFCRARQGQPTVRVVHSASWHRDDHHVVRFEVSAQSFCHQLVRSLVAALVDVGRGKVEANAIPAMLVARDRHAARGAAPPHGLTLVGVEY